MSSIDQQFVEFIVKSLVSNPDAVSVERRIDEKGVLLELTVDPEDLGRVIGKRGATAQSLRTLLRALGTKNDARYNLKIVDNGEPFGSQRPTSSTSQASDLADGGDSTMDDDNDDSSSPHQQADDNDDVDNHDDTANRTDAATSHVDTPQNSVVSKTRKELEAMDDLDL
jgi:predicted RNA-binding protein YlqC (UPF0109 family)